MSKGSTGNPEAYQLYLKGKYYTNKLTKDGLAKGIDYFNQAIAIDPNYGLAYNGLAFNYINQDGWYMRGAEAGPKAKEAAQKALAIDPKDADAHLALAIEAQWYEWNWALAESEFKRAIELNPNDAEAHGYYSWFLAPMGRGPEALVEAKRGSANRSTLLVRELFCRIGLGLHATVGPGDRATAQRYRARAQFLV